MRFLRVSTSFGTKAAPLSTLSRSLSPFSLIASPAGSHLPRTAGPVPNAATP
jgi:hypothetical protein